jgi:hypothetical protein
MINTICGFPIILLIFIIFNQNIFALPRPEAGPKRPAVPLQHGPRWKYNFKVDIKEIGCEGVDWIHLAHERVYRTATVNVLLRILFLRHPPYMHFFYDERPANPQKTEASFPRCFCGERPFSSHPSTKLENHPISVVIAYLFNTLASTLDIYRTSPPFAT